LRLIANNTTQWILANIRKIGVWLLYVQNKEQNGATTPALIAPKGLLLSIIAAPGAKAPGQ
jgi:hypothetical protein